MAHGPQPPRQWPRPGSMPAPRGRGAVRAGKLWGCGRPRRRAAGAGRGRGPRGGWAARVSCHIDTAGRLGTDVKPERAGCLPRRQHAVPPTHEFGAATHPLDQNLSTSRSTVGLTVRGCRNGRKAASDAGSGAGPRTGHRTRTPDRARGTRPQAEPDPGPGPGARPQPPGGPAPAARAPSEAALTVFGYSPILGGCDDSAPSFRGASIRRSRS